MLISEDQFQQEFGRQYHQALEEAKAYVACPEKLKVEIEAQKRPAKSLPLGVPVPDAYHYRLIRYRGFVRFPDRLKNWIVAQLEEPSETRAFSPTLIDVEPVSRCNFRCVMCVMSEWKGKRADDLTLEQFRHLLEQHSNLTEMKVQGIGEPLLHHGLFKMIRLAVERDIWVRTTVNGSLLHLRDNYRHLIDSGVGEIQTSFDGADKKTFEQIRRHSNFDRVVANLTLLNGYANTKDRLYTRMWVLVQRSNRHQLFDFVELAKRMGFKRLTFSIGLVDWGKEDWRCDNHSRQAQKLTAEEEQKLAEAGQRDGIEITIWDSSARYTTQSVETLCPAVFSRSSISSDCRLVPCGMVSNPMVSDLGNAADFHEGWNGLLYRSFRKAHLEGNIPEFCRGCYKDFARAEQR